MKMLAIKKIIEKPQGKKNTKNKLYNLLLDRTQIEPYAASVQSDCSKLSVRWSFFSQFVQYVCVQYVCVYVCICVLCQRFQPFGHKIFFSLAVSVSLRRLPPEVRAYCKHSALKLWKGETSGVTLCYLKLLLVLFSLFCVDFLVRLVEVFRQYLLD